MRYMVIEKFKPGCRAAVYDRFRHRGRLLPVGLVYLESWLAASGDRCFQLMETDDPHLFDSWIPHWADLIDFEIVPIGDKPDAAG